jgi:hypothetical protein
MKKPLAWLMNTKAYSWVLLHVVPYIRFTTYYTSLRGAKYKAGYQKLMPGHIILTEDKKKLTSILIPGMFAHAALCLAKSDSPDEYEVAEMTHTNYTKIGTMPMCRKL